MDSQKEKILSFIENESYVPMKAKEIADLMCVPKSSYSEFVQILKELTEEYKICVNRKGKYSSIKNTKYKKGIIKINEKGFGFVKIEGDEEEIYISGKNTNSALNEDEVVVEIIDEKDKANHSEGKIVKVLKRGKDTIVGIFEPSRNFGFVVPDDKKFGSDIFISKKHFGGAKKREKVVVKITKYPEHGKKAEGKIIEVIGRIDMAGVDMLSLVREYDLPYEFPKPVIEEANAINQKIDEKDFKGRLDLRDTLFFTIDGEDAKDLDDAVSVTKNESGTFNLIVSIADVSHYVREGSELDREAILRGTSIYMMDRVIPMLPKELSNGICSLNAKEDRLALSVLMEIDKHGKVVASDVQKSIVNVKERMSYSGVYKIVRYIEGEQLSKEELDSIEPYKQYEKVFSDMIELAKILKEKRVKDGALDLDVPESKITLDDNGIAIDVKKYEINFANEIIEQFMLIANEVVAEKFYWLEAPFIYRVHETPDSDKIDELNKFLFNIGYKVRYNKDNIHPKAFAEVLDKVKGSPEERVVSNLVLRTLKLARYESTNKGHFGIASRFYCHFTSPIRRYPDLFIHRIITNYIDNNYNIGDENLNKYAEQSANYAERSSEREKIAQKVERDSEDIKKAEYMQDKIGMEYDGIISSITSFGIFVELENTVEGLIRFENLGNEYFIFDPDRKILAGEHTNTVYKIGQKVRIRVIEANKELRRISFEIVEQKQFDLESKQIEEIP
ncbi:MAG: ribonuclease R [Clostridia bacterium]|nr:ribonuclease R [Clostridia bacterium]